MMNITFHIRYFFQSTYLRNIHIITQCLHFTSLENWAGVGLSRNGREIRTCSKIGSLFLIHTLESEGFSKKLKEILFFHKESVSKCRLYLNALMQTKLSVTVHASVKLL